jgi:cellulose synthase/poly-beta-1,6-N-acetylglucosamine synthase-like glycosyltransferase
VSAQAYCVCVPARDEAALLPALLAALAGQSIPGQIPVVLALNNCTDRSVIVAREAQARYAGRLELLVSEQQFPPAVAHAGSARRAAMALGAERLKGAGILLTTDADARPPPVWIAANLAALAGGLDIVGGRLELDEQDALPPGVRHLRARLDEYWRQIREIEDEIDPVPSDPAPRHGDHTGASLAVTLAAYQAAGGVPLIPTGEDRALVRAVVANGGRLGHPADVWVRVSPRRHGRAAGGMAQAMDRLHEVAASGEVLLLPDFRHWRARAAWRRATRAARGISAMLALEDGLPPMPHDMPLP